MNESKTPTDLVRRGYDTIATAYTNARTQDSEDVALLDDLIARLPENAQVLDAGCGGGVPIAKTLSLVARVTGMDFSRAQLALARERVPAAQFLCADLNALPFAGASFDAVVSYYAIIHIPREYHAALFQTLFHLLEPGGLALLCLGANDISEDLDQDYLGAPMFWSHFDAATNLHLLESAGFQILWSKIVSDFSAPNAGHLFVLALKPGFR